MSDTVLDTKYQITSSGLNDAVLIVDIAITKVNDALPEVSEAEMVEYMRAYLATLTLNPVALTRIQTIQTDGL